MKVTELPSKAARPRRAAPAAKAAAPGAAASDAAGNAKDAQKWIDFVEEERTRYRQRRGW